MENMSTFGMGKINDDFFYLNIRFGSYRPNDIFSLMYSNRIHGRTFSTKKEEKVMHEELISKARDRLKSWCQQGSEDTILIQELCDVVEEASNLKYYKEWLKDEVIKHMAERFLQWPLPKNFNPDGGIIFEPVGNKGTPYEYKNNPIGTNLFDYTQAKEMVEFMLDGEDIVKSEEIYRILAEANKIAARMNGSFVVDETKLGAFQQSNHKDKTMNIDDFSSLESELYREYTFSGGDKIRIVSPVKLHVSASGGHRILDAAGVSHYIPAKWIHLTWEVKDGCKPFDF